MRRYFLLVIILIPIAVYGFILYGNGTLSAIAPSAKPYLPAITDHLTQFYEKGNALCLYTNNLVLNRTLNDATDVRVKTFEPGSTRPRTTHTYKKTSSPACNECERFEKMGLIRRQPQEGEEPGDYVFVLTASGKEAYVPADREKMDPPKFCLGKPRFNQIVEASPPTKSFSNVTYMAIVHTIDVTDPHPALYSPHLTEEDLQPVFPQGKTTSIPILATFMTTYPDKIKFYGVEREFLFGKWIGRQNGLEKQIKAELQSRAAKEKSSR